MGLILSALVLAYMKVDKVQRWAVPAIVIFCLLTIISSFFAGGDVVSLFSVTFVVLLAIVLFYRWLRKLQSKFILSTIT